MSSISSLLHGLISAGWGGGARGGGAIAGRCWGISHGIKRLSRDLFVKSLARSGHCANLFPCTCSGQGGECFAKQRPKHICKVIFNSFFEAFFSLIEACRKLQSVCTLAWRNTYIKLILINVYYCSCCARYLASTRTEMTVKSRQMSWTCKLNFIALLCSDKIS